MVGGGQGDTIFGGEGDDRVDGGEGHDVLHGWRGRDTLAGGNGHDTLRGEAGGDLLFGNAGEDRLFGDGGDDLLDVGAGADRAWGGAGRDVGTDLRGERPASSRGVERMVEAAAYHEGAAVFDRGDFYWYFDERIALFRQSKDVLVGVEPGVDAELIIEQLTGVGGALRGFEGQDRGGGGRHLYFSHEYGLGALMDEALEAIRRVPGVAFVTPGLVTAQGFSWLAPTAEVIVHLEPGVDPEPLLAPYGAYRPSFGQYLLTLERGGGLDALVVAAALHGRAGVTWASPNMYAEGSHG